MHTLSDLPDAVQRSYAELIRAGQTEDAHRLVKKSLELRAKPAPDSVRTELKELLKGVVTDLKDGQFARAFGIYAKVRPGGSFWSERKPLSEREQTIVEQIDVTIGLAASGESAERMYGQLRKAGLLPSWESPTLDDDIAAALQHHFEFQAQEQAEMAADRLAEHLDNMAIDLSLLDVARGGEALSVGELLGRINEMKTRHKRACAYLDAAAKLANADVERNWALKRPVRPNRESQRPYRSIHWEMTSLASLLDDLAVRAEEKRTTSGFAELIGSWRAP